MLGEEIAREKKEQKRSKIILLTVLTKSAGTHAHYLRLRVAAAQKNIKATPSVPKKALGPLMHVYVGRILADGIFSYNSHC